MNLDIPKITTASEAAGMAKQNISRSLKFSNDPVDVALRMIDREVQIASIMEEFEITRAIEVEEEDNLSDVMDQVVSQLKSAGYSTSVNGSEITVGWLRNWAVVERDAPRLGPDFVPTMQVMSWVKKEDADAPANKIETKAEEDPLPVVAEGSSNEEQPLSRRALRRLKREAAEAAARGE